MDEEKNTLKNNSQDIKDVVYHFYKHLYTKESEDQNCQMEFVESHITSLTNYTRYHRLIIDYQYTTK